MATKLFTDIGLTPCPNAPCLTSGTIKGSLEKIYGVLYVDGFIHFGDSAAAEAQFEKLLSFSTLVTFNPDPSFFLGIKILRCQLHNYQFSIHLSQEVIIHNLMSEHNLSHISTKPTPYRSSYPVDKTPTDPTLYPSQLKQAEDTLRSLVGSFNWLALATCPDITTITNMSAGYLHYVVPCHVSAAKYVLQYLIGTPDLGIEFSPSLGLIQKPSLNFLFIPKTPSPSVMPIGPHRTNHYHIPIKQNMWISSNLGLYPVSEFGWVPLSIGYLNVKALQLAAELKPNSMTQMNTLNLSNTYPISSII